jgi:hypothetical protein
MNMQFFDEDFNNEKAAFLDDPYFLDYAPLFIRGLQVSYTNGAPRFAQRGNRKIARTQLDGIVVW